MKKVFIDTDVVIDYTKGFGEKLEKLLKLQDDKVIKLYINPIVVAEFFTDNSLQKEENLRLALKLFETFNMLNLTKPIGLLGGEFMRTKQVLFIGDALIAATCIHHNLLLATNNKRDFKLVKKLRFYEIN